MFKFIFAMFLIFVGVPCILFAEPVKISDTQYRDETPNVEIIDMDAEKSAIEQEQKIIDLQDAEAAKIAEYYQSQHETHTREIATHQKKMDVGAGLGVAVTQPPVAVNWSEVEPPPSNLNWTDVSELSQ